MPRMAAMLRRPEVRTANRLLLTPARAGARPRRTMGTCARPPAFAVVRFWVDAIDDMPKLTVAHPESDSADAAEVHAVS